MSNFPSVGHVAFGSSLGFAAVTLGAGIAAAGATSTVATVAFGALAIGAAGAGIAAGTAYFAPGSDNFSGYYENFKKHACVVIGTQAQMIAQEAITAMRLAIRDTLRGEFRRKFSSLFR